MLDLFIVCLVSCPNVLLARLLTSSARTSAVAPADFDTSEMCFDLLFSDGWFVSGSNSKSLPNRPLIPMTVFALLVLSELSALQK